MLRTHRVLALAAAAALVAATAVAATAVAADGPARSPVRVERIAGEALTGDRVVSLDGNRLVLADGATTTDVPLDDVVEVLLPTPMDPTRAWAPMEVAVDLWSGETLLGDLKGGDGEHVDLDSPLLGRLKLSLDRIATVRFLQHLAQASEPPDLRPRKDADVVHLVGGDQFSGTLEGFSATGLKSVTPQKETVEVPYERLVAVALVDDAKTARPVNGGLRAALRDGARIVGSGAHVASGRLRMKSASGFDVDCALADVVAVQSQSERFAFLSDVPAATTTVKPVWDVAAGDPAVLFAPRLDRSFSGRPLRCGGRTWLDGIGVFSGTTMTWDLAGKYAEFRTSAGLDDAAGPLGGVVFQVLVDGKEAWSSGFVRPAGPEGRAAGARGVASPVSSPRIPLAGAKTLTLVVLAGDAEDPYPVQDEADWLGAILVRAAAK